MAYIPTQFEPPGEIIREELEARGWTQSDLAEVTGRPLAAINEIINGKRRITVKTAKELAAAFGVTPQFWLNLESAYQLSQSGTSTSMSERAKLLEYAPVKEMQRRNWLPKDTDFAALRDATLKFFGTPSIDQRPQLVGAFRQSAQILTTSHIAWCIRAMQIAEYQQVRPYKPQKAAELKDALRAMAAHAEEIRRVPMVLAEYGIRFVVVKHLRSTKTDGAALWLSKAKQRHPVIVMSLRYGRIDNFWHTLCHEVSHIIHKDGFRLDVELDKVREGDGNEIEQRANEEAASMLIPQDELHSFILRKRPYFSSKSIIQFAHKIRIHPGIIVGQLQYRKAIKYTHGQKMLVQIRDMITETAASDGWNT